MSLLRRGRVAAQTVEAALTRLSLSESACAKWLAGLRGQLNKPPFVDEVQVAGLVRTNESIVRQHLEQHTGQPLDTQALNRDLLRTYGDGFYETVDYTVQSLNGRHVLRVTPVEKSWGPDYIRLGARFDSNLRQGSSFQLRGGYHKTWLNTAGGELLLTAKVGRQAGAGIEFFQPLSLTQAWFMDTAVGYRRERVDLYNADQRFAECLSLNSNLDLMLGASLHRLGQIRAGWRWAKAKRTLQTGIDILANFPERTASGVQVTLDLDQFIGDHVVYGHVRAERILGRLPAGLRGDMRIGMALEAGKLMDPYTPMRHTNWLGSLALHVGGETPAGPVYVGIGRGRSGSSNAYLFLGTP